MTSPAEQYDRDAAIQRIDANVQWLTATIHGLLENLNRMPGFKGMMARKVTGND